MALGSQSLVRAVARVLDARSSSSQVRQSAAAEEDIRVFAVPSFEEVASFVGHTAGVSVVTFSPSSKLLASASDDDTVRIWQIDDDLVASRAADALSLGVPGRFGPLSTLIGHTGPVYCAAWGPRGDIIASGSVDEMIRLWDVQRGACVSTILSCKMSHAGTQGNVSE